MHAKKRLSVLFLVGLAWSCSRETNAQEPIPLFEFEDKEPKSPDLAQDLEDPGPPVHPTAPPSKPTPLVFGPGKLPWAPQGYTVYFHLREEAEWTAKYDGKFWRSGEFGGYLQKNKIKFVPNLFLAQRSSSVQRIFEAVLLPNGFWSKDKTIHFFEISRRSYPIDELYFVDDAYIKGGYLYNFKSNEKSDLFFYKDIKKLSGPHQITMSSFRLTTKGITLSDLKSSYVWEVKAKLPLNVGLDNISEDIKEEVLKDYCYSIGLSFVDLIENKEKGCSRLLIQHRSYKDEIDPTSYETSQINPK